MPVNKIVLINTSNKIFKSQKTLASPTVGLCGFSFKPARDFPDDAGILDVVRSLPVTFKRPAGSARALNLNSGTSGFAFHGFSEYNFIIFLMYSISKHLQPALQSGLFFILNSGFNCCGTSRLAPRLIPVKPERVATSR